MDMEEHLQHRREQYRLGRDRETLEEAERRRHRTKNVCDVEKLQYQWIRELKKYKLVHQLKTLCAS